MAEVVLRAHELTRRYGALVAVDRLSLEVYAGEVFGFLGPNGAGKTTSIHMMCGLLRPDAGWVEVHGRRQQAGGPDVRARTGLCPQEVILWERLTCMEQLVFIGRMYGLSAGEALRRSRRLLDDLDLAERRGQQARHLSGGIRRRLNLAMALVHDPDLVVLDEAEAGLDPQSRVRVREYIRALAGHKTVILTTHNMDEAERMCDRVAIIDRGRLLVVDTPEALNAQVGEGDVLEIGLPGDGPDQDMLAALRDALPDRAGVEGEAGGVVVRVPGAVTLLPRLLELLAALGAPAQEVRLRQNTLEDVFIHLTGRSLRE